VLLCALVNSLANRSAYDETTGLRYVPHRFKPLMQFLLKKELLLLHLPSGVGIAVLRKNSHI